MRLLAAILLTTLLIDCASAQGIKSSRHVHPEKYYQELWCNERHGVMEYRLDDGTRVDCLTEEYAVEMDFAPKWAEAAGQALYYGVATNRRPGVVLIQESEGDSRFLERLQRVAERYHITVWTMTPDELF